MGITIKYKLPGGEVLQDSRQWKPEFQDGKVVGGKWLDRNGKESPVIQFALLGVNKKIPMDQLEFDATLSISSSIPNNTMTIAKKIKAFNGTANFDAIEQLVDIVKIDATNLDFARISTVAGDIERVESIFIRDGKTISRTILPKIIGGQPNIPEPSSILFPKSTSPIQVTINFRTSDGKKIPWSENGELQQSEIFLSNIDWKTF